MNLLRKHVEYLKDNPKGYWFKRKLYGWGWTPVQWQGWVVVLTYVSILLLLVSGLDEVSSNKDVFLRLLLPLMALTFVLIGICYKKGEKPRWQWGIQDKS